MQKQFKDSGLVIHYIQQMLQENFNSDIKINSEYYPYIDMNYGFAHYIAKYLDHTYPLLDKKSISDYSNIQRSDVRPLTEPISICNYFLSDNKRHRLMFSNFYTDEEYATLPTSVKKEYEEKPQELYREIYNRYMVLKYDGSTGMYKPGYPKYFNHRDLPLFCFEESNNYYKVDNNIIFTLQEWGYEKEICELDDLVTSYLLGRTITPNSSREDIYYVQQLLIRDRNITREEKGVWCIPGMEGTQYDLTQTIINYQKQRVNPINGGKLFVTGYFDIFTEAYVLKEVGVKSNGIFGL